MSRLREKYEKEVVPALMERFGYKNIMQVPKVEKVVINIVWVRQKKILRRWKQQLMI